MTLEPKKLDITDRIVGKLNNGQIQLFLDTEQVGTITLPEGSQFQLDHHYESDQQRIYQHVYVPGKEEPRYTDCDEGGWC